MSEAQTSQSHYLSKHKNFMINKFPDGSFLITFLDGDDDNCGCGCDRNHKRFVGLEQLDELSEIVFLCVLDQKRSEVDEDEIPF